MGWLGGVDGEKREKYANIIVSYIYMGIYIYYDYKNLSLK